MLLQNIGIFTITNQENGVRRQMDEYKEVIYKKYRMQGTEHM